ncbi:MAG: hypothetical protein R3C68_05180 [Myxococcota bacterium]
MGHGHVSSGFDSQAGFTLEAEGPVIVTDLSKETRFSGSQLLFEHGVVSGMSCTIPGDIDPTASSACTRETYESFPKKMCTFYRRSRH